MSPVKVLLATPDFPPAPGGIQVVAHRLAATGTGRVDTRVITLKAPETRDFDRDQSFPIVRSAATRLPQQARIALLNARILWEGARMRPDAVLSLHIVMSPAARLLGRVLGIPVIQYLHADEMRTRPGLTRRAVGVEAVIAVSEHTRSMALDAGADPARTLRIPNGTDLPAAPTAQRTGPPVILTVGRLTQPYKGHDVMIEALRLIRARVPGVRWVVVGDGPLRPGLERAVAAAGLQDAVSFLGAVSAAERDRWLGQATVFAMPSRLPAGGKGGEGFGIAFLEASAHGLPVVAGNVGGALDAVRDGVTGVLVDPTDPAAVAGAVADLLEDPARARALGAAGAEWAREFAWERVTARVEDVVLEARG